MAKKAAAKIMLLLLLIYMFTSAFIIPLTLSDFNVTTSSDDHKTKQETNGQDLPSSSGSYEKTWDFIGANEWGNFVEIDNDSMEMIIGIDWTRLDSYEQLSRIIIENHGELVNTVLVDSRTIAAVADVPLAMISTILEEVEIAGLSRYVEPNVRFQASFFPNDPYWPQQWGPIKIEADYAWNTTTGDSAVLVAVIDTGIDWDHPDLAANYVSLGYDWVNNDPDPMDDFGHGTHCAGIIAAVFDNSIGVAGLAQVKIMAEKGLDSQGAGTADDLANAIIHAVDQGADILSNSWGGYFHSELIYEAVKYAYDHEVLVVAAAGNDARDLRHYPACYKEAVAVTATNRTDDPASFTTFGEWVELAAPGVDIYSTIWDNSYTYMSGTSMSTPHVAGVASLILSQFPTMTGNQLRLQLQHTADDLGAPGFDIYFGYGRINARRAVEETPSEHDLNILSWDRPPYVEPSDAEKIDVTVLNFGSSDESSVAVRLLVNDTMVDSVSVDSLLSGATVNVSLSWNPTVEGKYNVTTQVVPILGEDRTVDNVKSAYINVRPGKFIMVPMDCQKIQEAVNLAHPREVIKVASGTYYAHVYINKPLKLTGENRNTTIIDADESGNPITIAADEVYINELTLQNSAKPTSGLAYLDGGCLLASVEDCVISNNRIINNYEGVSMIECHGNNTIFNNIINGFHDAGVGALYDKGNNFIYRNTISNPLGEGTLGIALIGRPWMPGRITCDNNTIVYNKVESKMGTDQFGILLTVSHNNLVIGNSLMLNSIGLWIANSKNNTVVYNNVTNNYCGIEDQNGVLGGVSTFYHNNMVNNTVQAESLGIEYYNIWDDGYSSGGNYWSDYSGTDSYSGPYQNETGSDRIGDTAYIIDENERDSYPLITPYPCIHAVAVEDVRPSRTVLGQGLTTKIDVDITNQGHFIETFNVTVHANTTIVNQTEVTLTNRNSSTVTFTWNTTGFALGNYTISAVADAVTNETYTADNVYIYGIVRLRLPTNDVAVINATPSKTVIETGFNICINVTVENQGDYTENFNVTICANTTIIDTLTNITLTSGNFATITFTWNTTDFAKGHYIITANATQIPGETDTTDNTIIDGTIIVTIQGDINGDKTVNILDAGKISAHWYPGPPIGPLGYDPNADLNNDGSVNILDAGIVSANWWQSW